jgi:hypothetical protein
VMCLHELPKSPALFGAQRRPKVGAHLSDDH